MGGRADPSCMRRPEARIPIGACGFVCYSLKLWQVTNQLTIACSCQLCQILPHTMIHWAVLRTCQIFHIMSWQNWITIRVANNWKLLDTPIKILATNVDLIELNNTIISRGRKTDNWVLRQTLANNDIMCYPGWDNIFAS